MIFEDQLNRLVNVNIPATRIISIVPSQTELLFDLGLDSEIIGITKFCIHPTSWFKTKEKIGGTKKLQLEKIVQLKPDLILANKEENTKEDIDFLESKFPTWISCVGNLKEAYSMINHLGHLVGKDDKSQSIIDEIENARIKYKTQTNKLTVCYLIWKDPYMTVGKDTFIHSMLEEAGFINIFGDRDRYPIIELQEIHNRKPDIVFLSSEPYPFKKSEIGIFKPIEATIVDGEAFSWYGSHLIKSFKYLYSLNPLKA